MSYHSIPSHDCTLEGPSSEPRISKRMIDESTLTRYSKWFIVVLSTLLVLSNGMWIWFWQWHQLHDSAGLSSTTISKQQQIQSPYPPTRTVLTPIYQDTEFNEEGKNKERADNLWKGLFPDGNGVLSLNYTDVKAHGLHDSTVDPLNKNNRLYIVAGYHTMHCVTVLRTALYHYYRGENQTAPWSHNVHCLDMIRQTLMCNLDTTLLWLWEPDTFADGQLHVCKDFWGFREWASLHAG